MSEQKKLGIDDLDVSNLLGSTEAITMLDQAIKQVSTERSKWGAYQNALGHIERNVTNRAENTNAAQSRVADADMAKEMAEYTTRKHHYAVRSSHASPIQSTSTRNLTITKIRNTEKHQYRLRLLEK